MPCESGLRAAPGLLTVDRPETPARCRLLVVHDDGSIQALGRRVVRCRARSLVTSALR